MGWSAKARVSAAAVLFVIAAAGTVASDDPLTESEAVRLFLEGSPQARMIPLIEIAAGAERRERALISNPTATYQVEDAAGVRDEFLTFEQELPITGRRGLLRDSADATASAATAAARRELLSTAAAVRSAFSEVLYRERALDRLSEGRARLETVVEALRSREREGEGSGYDVLRAEQELAEIGISTLEVETALALARSRFGAFYESKLDMASAALAGDLGPTGTIPDAREALELALSRRDDLRALRAEVQALDLEGRAARRQRFPEPVLTAGWKRVEALGTQDTGFAASLTLPLPIFDRGQVAGARADAERERIGLGIELLTAEIRAEVQAALARERAAREAAERYGGDIERRADELRRIAELSYGEGESGILELLDAQRSSLALELRALAVRYEAKRAEIDRDRALGIEVTP